MIPLTTKEDFINSHEFLAVRDDEVARIYTSSGTINEPVIIYQSHNDVKKTIEIGERRFKMLGVKRGDKILVSRPYALKAYYTHDISLMNLGAFVIQCGTGLDTPSEKQVGLALKLKPKILTLLGIKLSFMKLMPKVLAS